MDMYNIVTKNNDHLIDLQLNILFLFKKTHLPFFIWLTDVFYFILQWLVKTNNSTSVICLYVDRFINLNSIAGVLSWFKENRICHHLEKKKKKKSTVKMMQPSNHFQDCNTQNTFIIPFPPSHSHSFLLWLGEYWVTTFQLFSIILLQSLALVMYSLSQRVLSAAFLWRFGNKGD